MSVPETGGEILRAEAIGPYDPPEVFLKRLQNVDEDTIIASHLLFMVRALSPAVTGSPDQQLVEFWSGSIAVVRRDGNRAWNLICIA